MKRKFSLVWTHGGPNVRTNDSPNSGWSGLASEFTIPDFGFYVVAVHECDEVETDFLRARFVTFAMVGARTKEIFHGFHHGFGAFKALRLPLGDEI